MGKVIDSRAPKVAAEKVAEKPKSRGTQNGGDDNICKIMGAFEKEYKLIAMPSEISFLHEWIDDDGSLNSDFKKMGVVDNVMKRKKMCFVKQGGDLHYPKVSTVALSGVDGKFTQYPPMKIYQGVAFKPGRESTKKYNLFRGFPVKAVKGDLSLWWEVMGKAYDAEELSILMDWFASMYQFPGKKVTWSPISRGEKGTGKNTIEEMIGKGLLHPENYFRTADQNAIFGRFTGHMKSNLLIVGQEIVWGGEHEKDSSLKEIITESSRKLEAKGKDATTVDNFSRLYMTSNAEWVVPASGKSERRYFILDTKPNAVKAKEWASLYKWYESPGAKEALMYEMMNRDLSSFPWHKAPYSKGLASQQERGLYGVGKFVFTLIEEGKASYRKGNDFVTVPFDNGWRATPLFEAFKMMFPRIPKTQTKFGRELRELLLCKKRSSAGTIYEPHSRRDCATFFEENTGVLPDVTSDGGKWHGDFIEGLDDE